MARIEIYGDEAGDFSFSGKPGSSRYFIVTTVVLHDDRLEHDLLDLRKALMRDGIWLPSGFHAKADPWSVRHAVYSLLDRHDVRVDATIIDKSNVGLELRASNVRLLKVAWFRHLRRVIPHIAAKDDDLTVVAAAVSTGMRATDLQTALVDIVEQVHSGPGRAHTAPASSDLAIQMADYAGWAIQRRWERGTTDVYQRIQRLIRSEQQDL